MGKVYSLGQAIAIDKQNEDPYTSIINSINNSYRMVTETVATDPDLKGELSKRYEVNRRLASSPFDRQVMINAIKGLVDDPETVVDEWIQAYGFDPKRDIYTQLAEKLTPGAKVDVPTLFGGLVDSYGYNADIDVNTEIMNTDLYNSGLITSPESLLYDQQVDQANVPSSVPSSVSGGGSLPTLPSEQIARPIDLPSARRGLRPQLPPAILPTTQRPLAPSIKLDDMLDIVEEIEPIYRIQNVRRLYEGYKRMYGFEPTRFLPLFGAFPVQKRIRTNERDPVYELKFANELGDTYHRQESNSIASGGYVATEEYNTFKNTRLLLLPLPAMNIDGRPNGESAQLYGRVRAEIKDRIDNARRKGYDIVRWILTSDENMAYMIPTFYNEETGIYEPIKISLPAPDNPQAAYPIFLAYITRKDDVGHFNTLISYYEYKGELSTASDGQGASRQSFRLRRLNDPATTRFRSLTEVQRYLNKNQVVPFVLPYNLDEDPFRSSQSAGRQPARPTRTRGGS